MLSADEIERIAERAEKATPGPWYATEDLDDEEEPSRAVGVARGEVEVRGEPEGDWQMIVTSPGSASYDAGAEYPHEQKVIDCEFIAHCRQDVPALLETLHRTRIEADVSGEIIREILEYLCIKAGISTTSSFDDAPARNYELADRCGHILGAGSPKQDARRPDVSRLRDALEKIAGLDYRGYPHESAAIARKALDR